MKYAAADLPILSLFIAPLLFGLFCWTARAAVLLSILWAVAASLFIVIWYGSFFPFEGSVGLGAKSDALAMSAAERFSSWTVRLVPRIVFAWVYAAAVFWCKEKARGRGFSFPSAQKQFAAAALAVACLLTGFEYYREQQAAEQRAMLRQITDGILRGPPQYLPTSPRK